MENAEEKLKKAVALIAAIIELSDRAASAPDVFSQQGALWALQKSIQKNRPRVVKLAQELAA